MLDDRRHQPANRASCEACCGLSDAGKIWGRVVCYPCFAQLDDDASRLPKDPGMAPGAPWPEARALSEAHTKRFRDWCHRWIDARRSKARAA